MSLHEYYKNLENRTKKRVFLDNVLTECSVTEMIARSWIANPKTDAYRIPKPIYRPILSRLAGVEIDFTR